MTPIETLHYAIGELAYAIAMADGSVQRPEKKKFMDIVAAELRCENYGFDISSIIFQIMSREKHKPSDAYDSAMRQLKNNSHYLSPELKRTFIAVIEKIARAFPPVTPEENDLIKRFRKDIEPLKGDPIYYNDVNLKKPKWDREKE
jgi:uncharacterized tellurite resistance protein B-like protein